MDTATSDVTTTMLAASQYTGRLSTRLHLAREAAHLSHDALADDVGVTAARLRHIESGAVDPSVDEVRRLARRLDGADYLLATRPGIDDCYRGIAL